MLHSHEDVLQLLSTERRQLEAEAWAERLRPRRRLRIRTAAYLYALADRLAPAPSAPSADGATAGR
jgi:hypothetical protein